MSDWLTYRKMGRPLLGWGLILALLVTVTACSLRQRPAGEIRVGVIAPLTGEVPGVGNSTVRAAELAVQAMNDTGGLEVAGQQYRLTLFVEDSGNVPDTAVAVARKLINQDHVDCIIGPQISRNAIPVAAVAESANIPMISPYSTNPATTAGKEYVFRAAYIDSFQGEVMARFALEQLGVQKAAVLYDIANQYNRDIADYFRQSFMAGGGQIVAFEAYTTGETEFAQQLAVIQASKPQVLFLPNYSNEITLQARQARLASIEAIFLGSDSWELEQLAGMAELDGSFVSTHFAVDAVNDAGQTFVAQFRQRYDDIPDSVAALTYDAFGMLFQALQSQEQIGPQAIRDGLQQIGQFYGVTGSMIFKGHDPEKSVVILQIVNRTAQYYQKIEP